MKIRWRIWKYLSPDGEERLAGGVHEDYLAPVAGHVIVDPEDEVALAVKHGEPVAAEEEGLPPHGKHLGSPGPDSGGGLGHD